MSFTYNIFSYQNHKRPNSSWIFIMLKIKVLNFLDNHSKRHRQGQKNLFDSPEKPPFVGHENMEVGVCVVLPRSRPNLASARIHRYHSFANNTRLKYKSDILTLPPHRGPVPLKKCFFRRFKWYPNLTICGAERGLQKKIQQIFVPFLSKSGPCNSTPDSPPSI